VLAYFDDENKGYDLSPDLERDFTIIDDGDAIGITQSISGEHVQARWHFKDTDKIPKFKRHREAILKGAISYAEVKAWREKQMEAHPNGIEKKA